MDLLRIAGLSAATDKTFLLLGIKAYRALGEALHDERKGWKLSRDKERRQRSAAAI